QDRQAQFIAHTPYILDRFQRLSLVHASGWLIQQEQLGLCGQCPCNLNAPTSRIREIYHILFLAVYQLGPKEAEELNCTLTRLCLLTYNSRCVKERSQHSRFKLRMLTNEHIL